MVLVLVLWWWREQDWRCSDGAGDALMVAVAVLPMLVTLGMLGVL